MRNVMLMTSGFQRLWLGGLVAVVTVASAGAQWESPTVVPGVLPGDGARAPQATQPERPLAFEIPYLATPPTIDGVIDADEWGGATVLTGGVQREHNSYHIAPRQFRAWLGWDEDAIYLAVRSLQRPGQAFAFEAGGDRDNIEFSVLPFKGEDLRHPYRTFLTDDRALPSDIAGVRSRIERPPIITHATRTEGWTEGVEVASRTLPDPAATLGEGTMIWEVEARYPRETFAIGEPNAAGDGWRVLLSRTYAGDGNTHMPLINRSIHMPGTGGIGYFFDPRGYMQAQLVKDAPIVQLLDVLPLVHGEGGAHLAFVNAGAAATELTTVVTVRSTGRGGGDVIYESHDAVTVPAGGRVELTTGAAEGPAPAGLLELVVTGPDNRALLEYRAELAVQPKEDQ